MSNAMQFFSSMLEESDERLLLAFSLKDGDSMTITTTFFKGDNIRYQPFVVRGTVEELAKESGYWAEIKRFKTEFLPRISTLDDLDEQIKFAEKEKSEKLKKVKSVKQGRCIGACDQELLQTLLTSPTEDESYTKSLESANLQTLLELLPLVGDLQDKRRFDKASAELQKITGANAKQQGILFEKRNKQKSLF